MPPLRDRPANEVTHGSSKWPDLALTQTAQSQIESQDVRDAYDYLVKHAASFQGWECGVTQEGYITDFRDHDLMAKPRRG